MTKRKILIANWKTYIRDLVTVKNKVEDINKLFNKATDVIICPPSLYLQEVIAGIKNSSIKIGSQNISTSESDANTGEILVSMQKDIGCSHSIIGHSEIRKHYKESNNTVAIKTNLALKYNIIPIVCVGENIEIRKNSDYLKFLINQLITSLPPMENILSKKMIIAYEPIWSIGTGKIPSIKEIEEVLSILKVIPGLEKCQFIYGGSVNENNIKEINYIQSLDGALIGGVSTDINKLSMIYQILNSV